MRNNRASYRNAVRGCAYSERDQPVTMNLELIVKPGVFVMTSPWISSAR
jgi:hypothetical protein